MAGSDQQAASGEGEKKDGEASPAAAIVKSPSRGVSSAVKPLVFVGRVRNKSKKHRSDHLSHMPAVVHRGGARGLRGSVSPILWTPAVMATVSFERLVNCVSREIAVRATQLNVGRRPLWIFQEHARNIVKLKQEVKALKSEVNERVRALAEIHQRANADAVAQAKEMSRQRAECLPDIFENYHTLPRTKLHECHWKRLEDEVSVPRPTSPPKPPSPHRTPTTYYQRTVVLSPSLASAHGAVDGNAGDPKMAALEIDNAGEGAGDEEERLATPAFSAVGSTRGSKVRPASGARPASGSRKRSMTRLASDSHPGSGVMIEEEINTAGHSPRSQSTPVGRARLCLKKAPAKESRGASRRMPVCTVTLQSHSSTKLSPKLGKSGNLKAVKACLAGGDSLPQLRSNWKEQAMGKSASQPQLSDTVGAQAQVASAFRRNKPTFLAGTIPTPKAQLHASHWAEEEEGQPKLEKYLCSCEDLGITPKPIPLITGHSEKLWAKDSPLVDADLQAVTAAISSTTRLEEVDLDGNAMLTEASLVPFLEQLDGNVVPCLKRLVLRECRQAGQAAVGLLSGVLDYHKMLHLDVSGIPLASQSHLNLCRNIRKHATLTSLRMADAGLSNSGIAKQCLGNLLSSESLQELDVGWNCFSDEVCRYMGECLASSKRLTSLSLSNCSSVPTGTSGDVPLFFCLEQLGKNTTLTSLDISLNRINFTGALVLEEAAEQHCNLSRIDISRNPLGVLGMRSMLRLLLQVETRLELLESEGCESVTDAFSFGAQIFNRGRPGGRYVLDLAQPSHRAMLRMLYKVCKEVFGVPPHRAFSNISYTLGTPPIESGGVPVEGTLSLTFCIDSCMEVAFRGLEDAAFQPFMDKYALLMRIRPGWKKMCMLLAKWRTSTVEQQFVMLEALSQDFLLPYSMIAVLGQQGLVARDVVCCLQHCCAGGMPTRYLCLNLARTYGDYVRSQKQLANFLDFNSENPTGPYKLCLHVRSDFAVAEWLVLLNHWEAMLAKQQRRQDVSQHGGWSHMRNIQYKGLPLKLQVFQEWMLPQTDTFWCDYVSGRRLRSSSIPLPAVTFNKIITMVHKSALPPPQQLKVLRQVSDRICISTLQLREMMGALVEGAQEREDLFVLFFARIHDIWNEKAVRVKFEEGELASLKQRIGQSTYFPFMQPEYFRFKFDFSVHDDKLACGLLLKLAGREGRANIRGFEGQDPTYTHEDGTVDPLPLGVPRGWETYDKMPASGTFSGEYICGPEHVAFGLRTHLLRTYGGWDVHISEQEVMWWGSTDDAPEIVMEYLEFLLGRFTNIFEAFKRIDRLNVGNITHLDFERSIKSMGCKKFRGADEKQLITEVFHFVDQDRGGRVSIREWGVFEKIWKEMQYSIKEFVHFLERFMIDDSAEADPPPRQAPAVGRRARVRVSFEAEIEDRPTRVLRKAWRKIDTNHDGYIDEEEWTFMVRQNLCYFGNTRVIFRFLDKDDNGSISWDEFSRLHTFFA